MWHERNLTTVKSWAVLSVLKWIWISTRNNTLNNRKYWNNNNKKRQKLIVQKCLALEEPSEELLLWSALISWKCLRRRQISMCQWIPGLLGDNNDMQRWGEQMETMRSQKYFKEWKGGFTMAVGAWSPTQQPALVNCFDKKHEGIIGWWREWEEGRRWCSQCSSWRWPEPSLALTICQTDPAH